jgi:hypothetical protein
MRPRGARADRIAAWTYLAGLLSSIVEAAAQDDAPSGIELTLFSAGDGYRVRRRA